MTVVKKFYLNSNPPSITYHGDLMSVRKELAHRLGLKREKKSGGYFEDNLNGTVYSLNESIMLESSYGISCSPDMAFRVEAALIECGITVNLI